MCAAMSKVIQRGKENVSSQPQTSRHLYSFLRMWKEFVKTGERRRLFIAILALIVSSGTNLAFPTIIGRGIDFASQPESSPSLLVIFAAAISVFSVGAFASWLRVYSFKLTTHRVEQRMRKKLFHTLMLQVG